MRTASNLLAAAACLTILASAQEKDADPDFAKVPEPLSAGAITARKAGIQTAWVHALNAAHQIAASQGYRQRDTHWAAALPDKGFTIIPLQLFAGNDYYIVIGTDTSAEAIGASAFGPDRRLVKTAPERGGSQLVLHIAPEVSGRHYLRLRHRQAQENPVHCAVTYIYR